MQTRNTPTWFMVVVAGVAALCVRAARAGEPTGPTIRPVELVLPDGYVSPAGPPAPSKHAEAEAQQGPVPDGHILGVNEADDLATQPSAKNTSPVQIERKPVFPPKVAASASEGVRVEPTTGSTLLSTLLPLASVIGLAVALAWVVRKCVSKNGALAAALGGNGKSPAGILEVLGRYPIARGQTLVLLRLDRRVLLLSQTSGVRAGAAGMSTLAEITDAEEVASILGKVEEAEGRSMAKHFQALMDRVRDGQDEIQDEEGPAIRRRQITSDGDAAEFWPEPEPEVREPAALAKPADPVAALRARLAALGAGERAA